MCLSCGCGELDDDHGNPKNITKLDVEEAARAAGIEPRQAVQNIQDSFGERPNQSSYDWAK